MEQEKKKISAFEFAIMKIADTERAATYRPYTREEENKQRHDHIMATVSQIKIKP